MTQVSYDYESFYKSMKEDRSADRMDKRYPDAKGDNWNRARAKEEIRDAKEYVEKVNKMIEEIKKELN